MIDTTGNKNLEQANKFRAGTKGYFHTHTTNIKFTLRYYLHVILPLYNWHSPRSNPGSL